MLHVTDLDRSMAFIVRLFFENSIQIEPMVHPAARFSLTSSTGSSFSLGSELDSSPTRNGVGQQTMSIIEDGRTGMKVCCQEKGYSRATTA